jgi:hypothetical protein
MWSYSIPTVYDFYAAAVKDDKAQLYTNAHVMRLTGYSAREPSKKSNSAISKAWDGLLNSVDPGKISKKARSSSSQSKSSTSKPEVVAHDQTTGARQAAQAAQAFLAAGDFFPVRKPEEKA